MLKFIAKQGSPSGLWWLLGLWIGFPHSAWVAAQESRPIDFATQVRPLLAAKCFDCHGPETQESRLRLDSRTGMLRGGDSGEPAIQPGSAETSYLMELVRGRVAGKQMPPTESDRLTVEQINLLQQWIDQGAEWPASTPTTAETEASRHWSFQPLQPIIPPSLASDWIVNPIDAFVLEKLQQQALTPNPRATPAELIRRMNLDMLGLPPAPEEVRAFGQAHSSDAIVELIERLLSSPRYGERWARYWLDLVRFAETNGFETNRERPNAWPYRDYVIRALNEDKPYDRFIREQIAGDALGEPDATGYLVAGPYDLVKSPDINLTLMQRQNELDDMVATTGTAFLGLTIGCARCHNHKFDPIRQADYYSLQAVFAGVQHGDSKRPLSREQQQQIDQIELRLAAIRKELEPWQKKPRGKLPPVNPRENIDSFASIPAKYVRFTVLATNASQPCLDEVEVFSHDKNVALASTGVRVSCSSSLPGYQIHRLEHINDGIAGNAHSWISNESGKGWVQFEWPSVVDIQKIVWSRDREGRFNDRLATNYRIEVAVEPDRWQLVASSENRQALAGGKATGPEYELSHLPEDQKQHGQALLEEIKQLEERKTTHQNSGTVYAGKFQQPPPTFRLFRGEPNAKREEVEPNTVTILGQLGLSKASPEQERRLALANWMAANENPLTARVIVNRLWQFHFGKGLVTTPSDFGAAGVAPSHPELLDWLAQELMNHDWSLKHIQRLILTSATYQQSSKPRSEALQVDAGTEWWWRFPPRRLDAEPIRDSILSVSGVLEGRMFGAGFSAFEIAMENVRHYFPKKVYAPEDWRRMIYMTKVRLERESVFGIFDCPDAATSVPRRGRSTTPLQAFNLFNSEFMLQQAELFAARLQQECGEDSASQVTRAWWLCYGRPPSADELRYSSDFIAAERLTAFCRALLNSNEFIFLQ